MSIIPQFKVNMSAAAGLRVSEVLKSGYIGQGARVEEFERRLKEKLHFSHAVTVNSGSSALWLALHLAGAGYGDKVISTPMTCSATNEMIALRGCDIIWADVDKYGNIDPYDVSRKLTPDVRAVMAVDWGGTPCDYNSLRWALDGTDIPIIEDAAHAYLATYKDESICKTGGDYVCFSFQAIKHLTCGDGGLLVTPKEQYQRAVLLRWYGLDRTQGDAMRCRQDIREAGYKFHMNDINADIGISNLELGSWAVKRHRENAEFYNEHFVPMGLVPEPPQDRESSYWVYTIHVPKPLKFETFMKNKGVAVSQVHNRNDYFSCFSEYSTILPNLDNWFSTMTAIPVGWWLSKEDKQYIVDCIKEWIEVA